MIKVKRSIHHVMLVAFTGCFLSACGGDKIGTKKDDITSQPFYAESSQEWELVWSDEFDSDTLDSTKWSYDLGDGSDRGLVRWGNNEQQWYTNQNTQVSEGTLKIVAKQETVEDGFAYTSSRITTKGNLDITYGRVEASIKISQGQGLWGAFWMLPSDSPYGEEGWAATGEIDIMEAANPGIADTQFAGSSVFHGFPSPWQQSSSTAFPDELSVNLTEFNTYAVEWEQNQIRFFINDVHFKTISSQSYYSYYYDEDEKSYKLATNGAPFDTDFNLILNLAVGGNLTGNTIDSAAIPGELEVDYVRVYSCSYGLQDGKGCNSNVNAEIQSAEPLRPVTNTDDIYVDEPAVYTTEGNDIERALALNSYYDNNGALQFAQVPVEGRGNVIEVNTAGGGNISINPSDGEPIELVGVGNNPNPFGQIFAGELTFDINVKSADDGSNFLIKMDSGYPALGQVSLSVDELPRDTWTRVSIKMNDLLAFRGEGFNQLNTSNIQSIFVFEPTGAAIVQIDNIRFSCAAPGGECGVVKPTPPAPPITGPFSIPGIWKVEPVSGSLGVGPANGDISWFAITSEQVGERACFYNDTYVFNEDGSFQNVLGDDTWLESWQTQGVEGCGLPLSPHDGTTDATWEYDTSAGTLKIDGFGSYVGIPKAVNAGELPAVPTPPNVTYSVEEVGNNKMIVTIESGAGVWWQFSMLKIETFGDTGPAPERTFAGTWQVEPVAGSLGVGPAKGDISWFAIDAAGVATRNCFYDDQYVFGRDGSFENVLGDETWLEAWQGVDTDQCGAPVSPHNNEGDFTWVYTEGANADVGTLTLEGSGAYMGIPKANNAGEEDAVATQPSITYGVVWEDDNTVIIDVEAGAGVWWTYRMIKTAQPEPLPAVVGTWKMAPEAGSLGVGPAMGDISWFAVDDAQVDLRACFYDDQYIFGSDGSFTNDLGADTWLETWQGVDTDQCGEPVAPHDGSIEATWSLDEDNGVLTISGNGAYMGIPKALNNGELGADTPGTFTGSIEYMVELSDNDTRMVLDIEAGSNVWWRFVMEKQ